MSVFARKQPSHFRLISIENLFVSFAMLVNNVSSVFLSLANKSVHECTRVSIQLDSIDESQIFFQVECENRKMSINCFFVFLFSYLCAVITTRTGKKKNHCECPLMQKYSVARTTILHASVNLPQ